LFPFLPPRTAPQGPCHRQPDATPVYRRALYGWLAGGRPTRARL